MTTNSDNSNNNGDVPSSLFEGESPDDHQPHLNPPGPQETKSVISGEIPEPGSTKGHRAGTWETFLSDKPTEGEAYIEPSNIEFELSRDKRQECREIVREVKAFGISQRQTLFLIQLLAMELENFGAMKAIVKAVSDNRGNIPVKTTEAAKPKIILASASDPDHE